MTIDQANTTVKAFNNAYPNVGVNYLRSDDAEIYDRFNTQCKAGNVNADVVIIGYDGYSKEWDGKGCLERVGSGSNAWVATSRWAARGNGRPPPTSAAGDG